MLIQLYALLRSPCMCTCQSVADLDIVFSPTTFSLTHFALQAHCEKRCVGAIVCKLDKHRGTVQRGYIAMLAVDKDFRKKKIGVLAMQEVLVGL